MDITILQNFAVALVLGFLIGLERENKSKLDKDPDFAGVRTFSLIGILGASVYTLAYVSVWISATLSLGFVALIVGAYVMAARVPEDSGVTTEISSLLVFVIGMIAAMGNYFLATSMALAVMTILHFKVYLHRWAGKLKNDDIIATLQFILIAFVVLPLLPNEAFGPYDFFNPYVAWLMVVLISGLSFMSYIAMKIFGTKKGIGITGFLAGFISSTALALSFSEESKKNKSIVNPYVIAVIIASSAMFFRVLIEVAVISPELNQELWIPMAVMGGVGLFTALLYWKQKSKPNKKVQERLEQVKSPFSLVPALQFGVFFVGISLLAKIAGATWGNDGLYVTSVISGVLDVDAITVSIAGLYNEGLVQSDVAVRSITFATMTNTLIKALIFLLFASRKAALKLMLAMFAVLAAGGLSLFML